MPSRNELVAYGRDMNAVAAAIGADLVIFQDLEDLVHAVRQFNPSISNFDCSVFNGEYVTGDVDEEYLQHIERLRNDSARGELHGNPP
jgi:amidophosphoribosyltransferase